MTITSSKIVEDSLQAHDQRYIREVHTDHLGREHIYSYAGAGNVDADAIMAGRVVSINDSLVEQEIQEVVTKIENGEQMPELEFATIEQVKLAFTEKKVEHESDIVELTTKKTYLEAEVK